MNSIFKFLGVLLCSLLLVSCETNEEELLQNGSEQVVDLKSKQIIVARQNDCTISINNANPIATAGETRTFTVSHTISGNPSIQWSILNGAYTQILGSTTSSTFTVRFNAGFEEATIRVVVDGNSNDCDLRMTVTSIGGDPCPNPPTPAPIYSEFGTPVPAGYIQGNLGSNQICTTTINNMLSVPFDSCDSYSWSISPGGNQGGVFPSGNSAVVIINTPGTYRVTLVTSNDKGSRTELFLLYAQNCNGLGGGGF